MIERMCGQVVACGAQYGTVIVELHELASRAIVGQRLFGKFLGVERSGLAKTIMCEHMKAFTKHPVTIDVLNTCRGKAMHRIKGALADSFAPMGARRRLLGARVR